MDFSRRPAQEVVTQANMPRYNKGMERFSSELTSLNVDIFVLDHILSYPFHLLPPPGGTLFFRFVLWNFFSASILTITRLAGDQDADFFTLPRFKNWLLTAIHREFVSDFRSHLKSLRFDTNVQGFLRKAVAIRHTQIAHHLESGLESPNEGDRLNFSQLKAIRDGLDVLFAGLAFNTEYLLLPIEYHPGVQHPKGVDARPDIERLLDLIARNSRVLDLAQNDPLAWAYERETLSESDLEILNAYRSKFGLPLV